MAPAAAAAAAAPACAGCPVSPTCVARSSHQLARPWYQLENSCVYCNQDDYSADYGPRSLLLCSCCPRGTHVQCYERAKGIVLTQDFINSGSSWFCSEECEEISTFFERCSGRRQPIKGEAAEYTLEVVKYDKDSKAARSVVEAAKNIFKCAFDPLVMDNGLDLVGMCCTAYESPEGGEDEDDEEELVDYSGFRVVALRKGSQIVSVATLRVFGNQLAEMPFVATRQGHRRAGHCRRLIKGVEAMLRSVRVAWLVLPSIRSVLPMWRYSFAFMPLTLEEQAALEPHIVSPDYESAQLVKKAMWPPPDTHERTRQPPAAAVPSSRSRQRRTNSSSSSKSSRSGGSGRARPGGARRAGAAAAAAAAAASESESDDSGAEREQGAMVMRVKRHKSRRPAAAAAAAAISAGGSAAGSGLSSDSEPEQKGQEGEEEEDEEAKAAAQEAADAWVMWEAAGGKMPGQEDEDDDGGGSEFDGSDSPDSTDGGDASDIELDKEEEGVVMARGTKKGRSSHARSSSCAGQQQQQQQQPVAAAAGGAADAEDAATLQATAEAAALKLLQQRVQKAGGVLPEGWTVQLSGRQPSGAYKTKIYTEPGTGNTLRSMQGVLKHLGLTAAAAQGGGKRSSSADAVADADANGTAEAAGAAPAGAAAAAPAAGAAVKRRRVTCRPSPAAAAAAHTAAASRLAQGPLQGCEGYGLTGLDPAAQLAALQLLRERAKASRQQRLRVERARRQLVAEARLAALIADRILPRGTAGAAALLAPLQHCSVSSKTSQASRPVDDDISPNDQHHVSDPCRAQPDEAPSNQQPQQREPQQQQPQQATPLHIMLQLLQQQLAERDAEIARLKQAQEQQPQWQLQRTSNSNSSLTLLQQLEAETAAAAAASGTSERRAWHPQAPTAARAAAAPGAHAGGGAGASMGCMDLTQDDDSGQQQQQQDTNTAHHVAAALAAPAAAALARLPEADEVQSQPLAAAASSECAGPAVAIALPTTTTTASPAAAPSGDGAAAAAPLAGLWPAGAATAACAAAASLSSPLQPTAAPCSAATTLPPWPEAAAGATEAAAAAAAAPAPAQEPAQPGAPAGVMQQHSPLAEATSPEAAASHARSSGGSSSPRLSDTFLQDLLPGVVSQLMHTPAKSPAAASASTGRAGTQASPVQLPWPIPQDACLPAFEGGATAAAAAAAGAGAGAGPCAALQQPDGLQGARPSASSAHASRSAVLDAAQREDPGPAEIAWPPAAAGAQGQAAGALALLAAAAEAEGRPGAAGALADAGEPAGPCSPPCPISSEAAGPVGADQRHGQPLAAALAAPPTWAALAAGHGTAAADYAAACSNGGAPALEAAAAAGPVSSPAAKADAPHPPSSRRQQQLVSVASSVDNMHGSGSLKRSHCHPDGGLLPVAAGASVPGGGPAAQPAKATASSAMHSASAAAQHCTRRQRQEPEAARPAKQRKVRSVLQLFGDIADAGASDSPHSSSTDQDDSPAGQSSGGSSGSMQGVPAGAFAQAGAHQPGAAQTRLAAALVALGCSGGSRAAQGGQGPPSPAAAGRMAAATCTQAAAAQHTGAQPGLGSPAAAREEDSDGADEQDVCDALATAGTFAFAADL